MQGEITLVVEGRSNDNGNGMSSALVLAAQKQFVKELMDAGIAASTAAKLASKHLGASKRKMYDFACGLK